MQTTKRLLINQIGLNIWMSVFQMPTIEMCDIKKSVVQILFWVFFFLKKTSKLKNMFTT